MTDLIAFLRARLDEDEAAAKRMLEATEYMEWPWEVWVTPRTEGVQPSVATAEYAPKAYRRTWAHADSEYPHVDDGWHVHDSAICVWSEDMAKRKLRDVAAGRAILSMYQDAVAEAGSEAVEWMLAVIETKARVHSGHPDFDPAWAPEGIEG